MSFFRHKRWHWVGVAKDDVWLAFAVVDLGYAQNAFAYLLEGGRPIAQHTQLRRPSMQVSAEVARGRIGPIELDLRFDEPVAHAATVPLGDPRLISTTEKRVVRVSGYVSAKGRRIDLDGARGGLDTTDGLMPRRTRWRWAFALGPNVAWNLTEGFVGAAECALFTNGKALPLDEPHFTVGDDEWRIEGRDVDLRFVPSFTYAQRRNFLVVRSRFLQPAGAFYGKIGGVTVENVPGVVEDQDVLW